MSKSRLQIVGRIGQDAEFKEFDKHDLISFHVATNEKYKNGDGDKVEKTTWFKCEMWRLKGRLEKLVELLKKGKTVWIEGKPEVDYWIDKDGKACGMLKCKVETIEFFAG